MEKATNAAGVKEQAQVTTPQVESKIDVKKYAKEHPVAEEMRQAGKPSPLRNSHDLPLMVLDHIYNVSEATRLGYVKQARKTMPEVLAGHDKIIAMMKRQDAKIDGIEERVDKGVTSAIDRRRDALEWARTRDEEKMLETARKVVAMFQAEREQWERNSNASHFWTATFASIVTCGVLEGVPAIIRMFGA